MTLFSCHQWLKHNAETRYTESKSKIIPHYNAALLQILTSQSDLISFTAPHIQVQTEPDRLGQVFEEIYLTANMQNKEALLQPEVFSGIGITAVAYRRNTYEIDDHEYPLEGIYRPITFYVHKVSISAQDLLIHIKGKRMTSHNRNTLYQSQLAYAPAAAFLTLINKADIDKSSFIGLLTAERAEHRFGIFAIQEFSPNKTPLLMIHGLNSSPLIWRKLTMAVMNDEALNKRYQIWHAFYPSGPPPFYNAMRLRKRLKTMMGRFHQSDYAGQSLSIIGHSMGGIIAKTFAVDTGQQLWDTAFSKSPQDMASVLESNPQMQDIFIFSPPARLNNVFFLDTPHRGSEMASSWIGRLGAGLINLPSNFTNMFADVVEKFGIETITPPMRPFLATHGPNSIEVLRPDHPLMNKLNRFPLPERTWSIVGSDNELHCAGHTCLTISDGVVSWTSATLNQQANEEIIVASNHDSFNNDTAIEFILAKLRD